MQWSFNTPKTGPLSCVKSPIQKEKIKIVILSILNVLVVDLTIKWLLAEKKRSYQKENIKTQYKATL